MLNAALVIYDWQAETMWWKTAPVADRPEMSMNNILWAGVKLKSSLNT